MMVAEGVTTLEQFENTFISQTFFEIQKKYPDYPYHCVEHAELVLNFCTRIFDKLTESEEGKKLILRDVYGSDDVDLPEVQLSRARTYLRCVAAAHDVIQECEVTKNGRQMRKRISGMADGQNEGETSKYIYEKLKQYPELDFISLDLVRKHIGGTVTTLNYDSDGQHFNGFGQPHLDRKSVISKLLSYADLVPNYFVSGDLATMAERSRVWGDREFREIHVWISSLLKQKPADDLDFEDQKEIFLKMYRWLLCQPQFFAKLGEHYINMINEEESLVFKEILEDAVLKKDERSHFVNIENIINAATQRAVEFQEANKDILKALEQNGSDEITKEKLKALLAELVEKFGYRAD